MENTSNTLSFLITLQNTSPEILFQKRDPGWFPVNFAKFQEHLFYRSRIPLGNCFWAIDWFCKKSFIEDVWLGSKYDFDVQCKPTIQIFTEKFFQRDFWNLDLNYNNSTKYIQTSRKRKSTLNMTKFVFVKKIQTKIILAKRNLELNDLGFFSY